VAPTINIASAFSRKTHGVAGDFLLPITTGVPITGPISVEPRDGRRGHTLVLNFGSAISSIGSVSATNAAAAPVGSVYASFSGNTILVTLIGSPDNSRITVSLNGINGSGNTSISLGFLVGDVNGTRRVNGADISATKSRISALLVTAANFQFDLNQSGSIDSADLTMVKSRAGWAMP